MPRTITPLYDFSPEGQYLYPNMRYPAGYPDPTSGFKGVVVFTFLTRILCEDFMYYLHQSDSEGPTSTSQLLEFDTEHARIIEDA